ncbi:transglycosylase family protein [Corynebacterium incognita]|uniref:Transglycosylase family protein n=1 Tax=Corynebacterium incognita TaxID=2754725 RepID=A0A7G7CNQ5_9CORY|nr:resuscitation-promoting factor [Corynebacterium incognita]QNE89221.1 transglycosylase family protein [Corynebacterium incognita]
MSTSNQLKRLNGSHSVPLRLATGGVLGTLVVGGVVAAGAQKDITVDLNGEKMELATFSGDVEGALEAAGVEVGQDDVVYPAPSEKLNNGENITVRTAKQVAVTIDGKSQDVTSTALTIDDLMSSLDGAEEGAAITVGDGEVKGDDKLTEGMNLDVVTPKLVKINNGGKVSYTKIAAKTVADVVKERNLGVDDNDRVSPSLDAPVTEGMTIKVAQVAEHVYKTTETTEMDPVYVEDPELPEGEEKVLEEGKSGKTQKTYKMVVVNRHTESNEVIKEKVLEKAEPAKIARGTKKVEESADADASGASQDSSDGASADDSNEGGNTGAAAPAVAGGGVWDSLAQCESGGDWSINTGNGFSGGLQFTPSTWAGFGGTAYAPSAHMATREQQIAVASKVQAAQGWGAWPACTASLGIR